MNSKTFLKIGLECSICVVHIQHVNSASDPHSPTMTSVEDMKNYLALHAFEKRADQVSIMDDVADDLLEEMYQLVVELKKEWSMYSPLQPSIDTCEVCKIEVWTGFLVAGGSWFKFLPRFCFEQRRDQTMYLVCPDCTDCCGCHNENGRRDWHLVKTCKACWGNYCKKHQTAQGKLCNDCSDTLEFGKTARRLLVNSPDLTWDEFKAGLSTIH
jgi:hypothetical protein